MEKRILLLLVFLVFLGSGCSDNDGARNTPTAFNGQAILVDPFGFEDTMTPSFEWAPVEMATRYHLLVQETNTESGPQSTTETYTIDEWYTPEEAGCDSEENLCVVKSEVPFEGTYSWKVLACTDDECGLWSDELEFSYPPPPNPRFTDNGDGTVTDHYTELIWTRDANLSSPKNWWDATTYCWDLELADQSDWSLPSIAEIGSIRDIDNCSQHTPSNPFQNVQCRGLTEYWSSTTYTDSLGRTNQALELDINSKAIRSEEKVYKDNVWCVRGGDGSGAPEPYDGGCPDGSCQENAGPYRVYLFERFRGVNVPLEHVGFNLRSYAHSCKDWKKSVSSLGNQLTVNTGTCKSQKNNVDWIKNEVIKKGFTPISWATRYVAAHRGSNNQPVPPPGTFNFVLYGDFKPTVYWKRYTCPNVMIGMQTWGFGNNSWWFISNTTEPRTEGSGTWVVLKCTEDATGESAVLEVSGNFSGQPEKLSTHSFKVSVRE